MSTVPPRTPAPAGRAEAVAVVAILALFVAAVAAVRDVFGPSWIDEVCYADPAVNVVLGDGFVSRAWYAQDDQTFWAGNVPLHAVLLMGLFKLVGVSLAADRLLSTVAYAAAVGLVWQTARRTGWVSAAWARVGLVVVLLISQGGFNTWRNARPDGLAMLLIMATVALGAVPGGLGRLAAVGAAAALLPWVGLQCVAAVGVGGCVLFAASPAARKPVLAAFVGMAVGLIALYAFYAANGVWDDFFKSTFVEHSVTGRQRVWSGFKDVTYWAAIAVTGVALIAVRPPHRHTAAVLLAIAVTVPWALLVASKYHAYYAAFGTLPAAAAVAAALAAAPTGIARTVGTGLVAASCLMGVPFRMVVMGETWAARSTKPIEDLVARTVRPDDVVFAFDWAYFPSRLRAHQTYSAWALTGTDNKPWPTAATAKAPPLTLVIIRADDDKTLPRLGGTWEKVDGIPAPELRPSWLAARLMRLTSDTFAGLDVYRPTRPRGQAGEP